MSVADIESLVQKKTTDKDRPANSAVIVIDPNINIIVNPDLISENILAFKIGLGAK